MAEIKLNYSRQAELLIAGANVNKEEFDQWFRENIPVGSNNILEYILLKQQEKEKESKEAIEEEK